MPEDQEGQQSQVSQKAATTDKPFDPPRWMNWIGIYYLIMAVILSLLVFVLWPISTGSDPQGWSPAVSLFGVELFSPLDAEIRLLLIVVVVGALGSYVHAVTSFVSFVGNRKLVASWLWWYLLRPFIGMTLALIFYFVIRGGLLSSGSDSTDVNVFGVAAIAGLAGMFSKQATDKLREVFDNLFRTETGKGDDTRADKLEHGPGQQPAQ